MLSFLNVKHALSPEQPSVCFAPDYLRVAALAGPFVWHGAREMIPVWEGFSRWMPGTGGPSPSDVLRGWREGSRAELGWSVGEWRSVTEDASQLIDVQRCLSALGRFAERILTRKS